MWVFELSQSIRTFHHCNRTMFNRKCPAQRASVLPILQENEPDRKLFHLHKNIYVLHNHYLFLNTYYWEALDFFTFRFCSSLMLEIIICSRYKHRLNIIASLIKYSNTFILLEYYILFYFYYCIQKIIRISILDIFFVFFYSIKNTFLELDKQFIFEIKQIFL